MVLCLRTGPQLQRHLISPKTKKAISEAAWKAAATFSHSSLTHPPSHPVGTSITPNHTSSYAGRRTTHTLKTPHFTFPLPPTLISFKDGPIHPPQQPTSKENRHATIPSRTPRAPARRPTPPSLPQNSHGLSSPDGGRTRQHCALLPPIHTRPLDKPLPSNDELGQRLPRSPSHHHQQSKQNSLNTNNGAQTFPPA